MFNFDHVSLVYYRDGNSLFEAFKAGLCDYRIETDPTRWLTGYDIPPVREGRIIKETIPLRLPKGMEGFAFNTRHKLFADVRVREALGDMFDFEWINHNLYGDLYRRTPSFFADSELSSTGRPADAAEAGAAGALSGRGAGRHPAGHLAAARQRRLRPRPGLGQACARPPGGGRASGCTARSSSTPDGAPFAFEIMVVDHRQERLALSFSQSLARIGIAARVRLVDEVQYQRRRQSVRFRHDAGQPGSPRPSPGAEQRSRWSSASAKQEASFNLPGAASPAIDAAIAAILAARSQEDFTAAVRSLDRLLLSGFYIIPLFHTQDQWIAYSASLGRPNEVPLFGLTNVTPMELWWRRP